MTTRGYGETVADLQEEVERRLREAVDQLEKRSIADVELRVIEGEPGEQLVALSTTLDVLVVGSRRYGPLRSVLVGDVGTRLAMEARCALVIVPRGADGMVDP